MLHAVGVYMSTLVDKIPTKKYKKVFCEVHARNKCFLNEFGRALEALSQRDCLSKDLLI